MRVALFATCLADQFFANAVADAVRLLRALGVDVSFPPDQTCCGQPAYNSGHRAEARAMAAHTRSVFADAEYVVLPSGSCTAMLRAFYPRLVDPGEEVELWSQPGARAYELAEFLVEVLGVERIGGGLQGRRIAYHHGCHALRELGLDLAAPRLLRAAGAEIVPWEADRECCGFGGLFSVKFPEVSVGMADRKLNTLPPADILVSGDGGCLLHLAGRLRHRGLPLPVRHLASVLWEARADGAEWA